jgi:hypothetical protein
MALDREQLYIKMKAKAKSLGKLDVFNNAYPNLKTWVKIRFQDESQTNETFKRAKTNNIISSDWTIKSFYQTYACDLGWAKNLSYCSSNSTTGNDPQPTTELPSWTPDCVKNGVKGLSGTTDPNKVVYINDKGDKWYFSKNGDFLYIFKSGKRISGDYVCDDNDVVITTEDGEVYRGKNKKWLKKVTDSELQKKLKDKDDTSFWEDIKIGVPSLINKAGEWFHDIGEDAKKWWNDWRKEENNGNSNSSCNTNGWLKDPTGSKKYVFKVIECKWYTKNVSTCKEFNINDNLKYKRSVDILNKEYPNELKNCNKNQSSVNEPSWVKDYPCIRGFGEALPKNSDSKVSFKSSNGLDILNFYKNSKFSYEHESGEIMNGTWKCENNVIIIDTDDKARFISGKGWDYSKVIKKDQEIIKKDYEISPDDEIIYKQVDKDEF